MGYILCLVFGLLLGSGMTYWIWLKDAVRYDEKIERLEIDEVADILQQYDLICTIYEDCDSCPLGIPHYGGSGITGCSVSEDPKFAIDILREEVREMKGEE